MGFCPETLQNAVREILAIIHKFFTANHAV